MGRPPRDVVIRKLIKAQLKKQPNVITAEGRRLKTKLVSCWEQYGPLSPKCDQYIADFDHGWGLNLSRKLKMQEQITSYPHAIAKMVHSETNSNRMKVGDFISMRQKFNRRDFF